jgi:2-polyprenyl-3-methyl-5-hydroxy-6-metoxy-1,4-benzoquinol methylase
MDKAGVEYWNAEWAQEHAGREFAPDDPSLRRYPDRQLLALLTAAFQGLRPGASEVIEVGCANSVILPYVASHFGSRVAGIDYSPLGCEKARMRLVKAGCEGDIHCTDVFSPPPELRDRYDGVYSIGLIEHFTDSVGIVRALSRLLRPGGIMLTVIPNMNGAVGMVQKFVAPSIYKVHVPLDLGQLRAAHMRAGLEVTASGWHMPVGFGVVNFHEPGASGFQLQVRRGVVGALSRLSRVAWLWDEGVIRIPGSRLLSPYAFCIAERVSG